MDGYKIVKTPSDNPQLYSGVKINKSIKLSDGSTVLATAGLGVVVLSADGNRKYHLS